MAGQCATQRFGRSLVKENFHIRAATIRLDRQQTPLRMSQHKLNLLACHAGKPFQKIVYARAVFEIFKERPDRYARALEEPLTTDFPRHALDRRTLGPIKHGAILS